MLVYLASLAGISVAEVGSATRGPSPGTVSLEACVVGADPEALGQDVGGGGFQTLSSISAERLLRRIGSEGVEVISEVRILVADGAKAEISTENTTHEKDKDLTKQSGGHFAREASVSLSAEAFIGEAERVAVEFKFKQVVVENALTGSDEREREEENVQPFEVSSRVELDAGQPLIVGARRIDGRAMFLILCAKI